MSRPMKFQGRELDHVVALLKSHGPSKTREILAAPLKRFGKQTELGSLRNARIFPTPVKVSMPTLCKIGQSAGLEFQHGRVNPITDASNAKQLTKRAMSLVKKHGASAAAEMLKEEGVEVCAATLRNMARENDIPLVRGRRPSKKAA